MEYVKDHRTLKVCYLLLSDTIDRIDTILLELRHLQRNLIYFMHEPAFNAPLRFEEEFLWENEQDLLRSFDDESVIDENILLFPEKRISDRKLDENALRKSKEFLESIYHYSTEENKNISTVKMNDIIWIRNLLKQGENDYLLRKLNDLHKKMGCETEIKIINKEPREIWNMLRLATAYIIKRNIEHRVCLLNQEEWMIRHGRNYNNLRGTQLLKRLIVMDKVKFLRFALNTAGIVPGHHSEATINPAGLAKFVILRNAIHKRCTQYLARIMEYQSLFSKALDIGVKDFPVPLLERRREIGIYMEFLQDRVRAIHDEIKLLLIQLKVPIEKNAAENEYIILHSWTHNYTAKHHSHRFQQTKRNESSSASCHVYHIVTSYWMPERDDLQPVIAHEIAHLILQEHCDSLSDSFLQGDDSGQFADLLRSILTVLNYYDQTFGLEQRSPFHKPKFLIREIACDLLAASVKGFSYLHTLLLEAVGTDIYKHLHSNNLEFASDPAGEIELEMIEYLDGTGGRAFLQRRDWWLRLKVVICWLEHVHHWQPSGLDMILSEGTDKLLDNCLIFLDSITERIEDKTGDIWRSLTERLCEEIEESEAVTTVRNWRKKRSNAKEDDEEFPRSAQRINDDVIKVLKKIHIGMKMAEGKALEMEKKKVLNGEDIEENIEENFMSKYLFGKVEAEAKSIKTDDKYFYRHLHDIPWKCAITRCIDLFGNGEDKCEWLKYYNDSPKEKMLHILHHDNAMGRELYAIALEFYMFASENPLDSLTHSIFLIKNLFQEEGYNKQSIEKIIKDINELLLGKTENKKTYKAFRKRQNKANLKSENLLNEIKNIGNEKLVQLLQPLISYLSIYYENEDKGNSLACIVESITSLEDRECWKQKHGDKLRCFVLFLVSRYTTGGFYSMQDKDDCHNIFVDRRNLTSVGFMQTEPYLYLPVRKKPKKDQSEFSCVYLPEEVKYSKLSGRYDAMSFVRARPLAHCPLPYFGNHLYQFPSILTRREFGIRVGLNLKEKECRSKIKVPAGYISIILKRRSLRIPFVARILAALNDDQEFAGIKKEKVFDQYICKETDTALLLDGSADLLLIIRCQDNNELKRIADVIDLAYWLHQDFMVEKTEIILSVSAVEKVAENIAITGKCIFSIDCEIRCFEDRVLSKSLKIFMENIKLGIKDTQQGIKDKKSLLVTIEATAGRKDILLRFFPPCNELKKNFSDEKSWYFYFNNFREDLQKVLEGNNGYYIDRIEINVNKQPPKYEDLFEGNGKGN